MTVSYTGDVANASAFGCFSKVVKLLLLLLLLFLLLLIIMIIIIIRPTNLHKYSLILSFSFITYFLDDSKYFNPIPADVFFTQNSLEGYFLIVIQIYNIWYTFGKPLGKNCAICFLLFKAFPKSYKKLKSNAQRSD